MIKQLLSRVWHGKPRAKAERPRPVRARYDAAATNADNRRHWGNVDGLSAGAANSPGVRRTLRNRARYEVSNNSYARGIVNSLANDTIGTGPRLQLQLPMPEPAGDDPTPKELYRLRQRHRRQQKHLRAVAEVFNAWAKEIDLAGKLRTMRIARAQDGEAFAVLVNNSKLKSPIKLDVRLVEADQVTDASYLDKPFDNDNADGVKFDDEGNPVEYRVLRRHPGGHNGYQGASMQVGEGDWIPAASIVHWFRCDRPGQVRGVPDIMPALPLFAQLRRFTLATIAAAETAAEFAGVMYTDSGADVDPAEVAELDPVELEMRAMLTLPRGWRMGQIEAEHPATTYEMFKVEILGEIARCLGMPYNVAAGNSSRYNYASGRLDHQGYGKTIDVDQDHCELHVLAKIFGEWIAEAALIPGLIVPGLIQSTPLDEWLVEWFWTGRDHVDPKKEADAQGVRLRHGTTHRAREYAKAGCDVDSEDEKAAASYGISVEDYRARIADATFGPVTVLPADEEDDEE